MSAPLYLHRPCSKCPFLRNSPVKLRAARIRELAANALSMRGAEFFCHQTIDYEALDEDDDESAHHRRAGEKHCAGALIFSEAHGFQTQMMRIMERLGLYDPAKLKGKSKIHRSLEDWLAEAVDAED